MNFFRTSSELLILTTTTKADKHDVATEPCNNYPEDHVIYTNPLPLDNTGVTTMSDGNRQYFFFTSPPKVINVPQGGNIVLDSTHGEIQLTNPLQDTNYIDQNHMPHEMWGQQAECHDDGHNVYYHEYNKPVPETIYNMNTGYPMNDYQQNHYQQPTYEYQAYPNPMPVDESRIVATGYIPDESQKNQPQEPNKKGGGSTNEKTNKKEKDKNKKSEGSSGKSGKTSRAKNSCDGLFSAAVGEIIFSTILQSIV